MRFASALTTKTAVAEAVEELRTQVHERLPKGRCDLALLFVHPQYKPDLEDLVEGVRLAVGARHLLGCTGASIIGQEAEVETRPAISLLAAELPGVTVTTFHLTQADVEESTGPAFWHAQTEVEPSEDLNLLMFADPFSVQALQLVQSLNEAYAQAHLAGGLASGGREAGENRLILDEDVFEEGAIGVALSGNIRMETIVAQGCKPIGEPFTVTRSDRNLILELGGKPPLTVLQDMLPHLPQSDQQLAQKALFLGRVINEYKDEYSRGDFLIRNLIGHDPQSGALAVADLVRTGQTVQFQVRDSDCADQDLRSLLLEAKQKLKDTPPQGAVLLTCLGRGKGMYGVADHDITALHHHLGPVPTAGLFCNGEIGPIGGRAFVHGFTSVIAVFAEMPAGMTK